MDSYSCSKRNRGWGTRSFIFLNQEACRDPEEKAAQVRTLEHLSSHKWVSLSKAADSKLRSSLLGHHHLSHPLVKKKSVCGNYASLYPTVREYSLYRIPSTSKIDYGIYQTEQNLLYNKTGRALMGSFYQLSLLSGSQGWYTQRHIHSHMMVHMCALEKIMASFTFHVLNTKI